MSILSVVWPVPYPIGGGDLEAAKIGVRIGLSTRRLLPEEDSAAFSFLFFLFLLAPARVGGPSAKS